ncbi:ABC transporter substrate-binding protein [Allostella sp. ATCC 35155]|nr:ABC transporter substrate-binding protein [Stella sp. ATCC 35155]
MTLDRPTATRRSVLAGALALGLALPATALADSRPELVVQYTFAVAFDPAFERLKETFQRENPDVRLTFRAPHKDYDTGIQALLREAVTGDMPHVTYVGLNHMRVVKERGLAVELAPLMKAEGSTFEAQGWTPPLQALGQVDGQQLGLPFAMSMGVVYSNADLVRRAGGDPAALPRDWDGLLALAGRIGKLESGMAGMYMPWTGASGAWLFQGLVYGVGGQIMRPGEKKVAFDGKEGKYAAGLYRRMVDDGAMPDIPDQAARQQFMAGRMGFFLDSISRLSNFERAIGDRFELRTGYYPLDNREAGGLVTGGNAAVITRSAAKDPKVLAAAWRWLKFTTGPRGTNEVIRHVGYVPVNVLALEDPKLLKGYFDDRPRHRTAVEQIGLVREWFQFPGPNGVKINDTISEYLQAIVDKSQTPDAALAAMVREVNQLLPR